MKRGCGWQLNDIVDVLKQHGAINQVLNLGHLYRPTMLTSAKTHGGDHLPQWEIIAALANKHLPTGPKAQAESESCETILGFVKNHL